MNSYSPYSSRTLQLSSYLISPVSYASDHLLLTVFCSFGFWDTQSFLILHVPLCHCFHPPPQLSFSPSLRSWCPQGPDLGLPLLGLHDLPYSPHVTSGLLIPNPYPQSKLPVCHTSNDLWGMYLWMSQRDSKVNTSKMRTVFPPSVCFSSCVFSGLRPLSHPSVKSETSYVGPFFMPRMTSGS